LEPNLVFPRQYFLAALIEIGFFIETHHLVEGFAKGS